MAPFGELVRFAMSGNIVAIMDIRGLTAVEGLESRVSSRVELVRVWQP
jgi:hypothetical protein